MRRNPYAATLNTEGMGIKLLSDDDVQHIHNAALEILSTIGIEIECAEAQDYLEQAGAKVDRDKNIVQFPEYLVREAIASTPGNFTLAGKHPAEDVIFGNGRVNFIPFGSGIKIKDRKTGKMRPTTKQDIIEGTRLVDALAAYDMCMQTVIATDVPAKVEALHSFAAHFFNTKKNCLIGPADRRTAEALLEMAIEYTGSAEALRERPVMIFGGCTISPFSIPESTCIELIYGARYGIPVVALSMPMSGGMSPVTMPGSLAVTMAEVLGATVLSQAVRKGAPLMIGISSGILDQRKNAAAMVGCPEAALLSAGFAQMARYYEIPSFCAGG
ncbi:Glycine betaine methyltransferase [anaerobic digester metagenome]